MDRNISSRQNRSGLCACEPLSVPQLRKVDAGNQTFAARPPAHSPILVGAEGILARRERTDRSCCQTVGSRIVSANVPPRGRPRDRLAGCLRIAGYDEEPAGSYGVADAEAFHGLRHVVNSILEGIAYLTARKLPLVPLVLNRDVVDSR